MFKRSEQIGLLTLATLKIKLKNTVLITRVRRFLRTYSYSHTHSHMNTLNFRAHSCYATLDLYERKDPFFHSTVHAMGAYKLNI